MVRMQTFTWFAEYINGLTSVGGTKCLGHPARTDENVV
jgi:hypothetical protein